MLLLDEWGLAFDTNFFCPVLLLFQDGARVIFNINLRNGRYDIKDVSKYQNEVEILLLPGLWFRCVSVSSPAKDVSIVQLEQFEGDSVIS